MIGLLRALRRGTVRAAVAGAVAATALMISSPADAARSTYQYSLSGPANHSETKTGDPGDTGLCSPVETITFQGRFSAHVAATQPGLSQGSGELVNEPFSVVERLCCLVLLKGGLVHPA